MLEVRARGGAYVLDDLDREIPGDQFVTVERTPHIMNAIRAGDLERLDQAGDSKAHKAVDPAAVTPAPASSPARSAPHAGGVDPTHEWEIAYANANQEVAAGRLLKRHKKTDKENIQKGIELMLAGFRGADNTKPKPRSVRRWIMENFERCEHWWEPSKARPRR